MITYVQLKFENQMNEFSTHTEPHAAIRMSSPFFKLGSSITLLIRIHIASYNTTAHKKVTFYRLLQNNLISLSAQTESSMC